MAELSLEDVLNSIVEEAEAVSTNLTVEDKVEITKAGAKVFKASLEEVTKAKHYRHRRTGDDPHLADSVIMQNTNVDGMKNGASVVGWDYTKSRQGHLIEEGTKFPMYTAKGIKYKKGGQVAINGDHFVAGVRNDPQVMAKVVEAEAAVIKQIVEKRNKQ